MGSVSNPRPCPIKSTDAAGIKKAADMVMDDGAEMFPLVKIHGSWQLKDNGLDTILENHKIWGNCSTLEKMSNPWSLAGAEFAKALGEGLKTGLGLADFRESFGHRNPPTGRSSSGSDLSSDSSSSVQQTEPVRLSACLRQAHREVRNVLSKRDFSDDADSNRAEKRKRSELMGSAVEEGVTALVNNDDPNGVWKNAASFCSRSEEDAAEKAHAVMRASK